MNDEHESLTTLCRCRTTGEAEAIKIALSTADIQAFVFSNSAAGVPVGMSDPTPSEVQVPTSQLKEARSALALIESDAARIDWDQIDVGEPSAEVASALEDQAAAHAAHSVAMRIGPILGITILLLALIGFVVILLMT
jgi:hypothetical protein